MKVIKNVLYKVPTGEPVDLPLHHLMVVGATEFSGKTTLIEAAISNANYRGLTFRTKRGELGFEGATRIPIYFNDKGLVTWQNLIGLMNAMFGDKVEREPGMKYAIQTICKRPTQAQSLQEIYDRAQAKQSEYKEGTFKEETFGKLVNYLEEVLPQMKKVDYTDALELNGQGMYTMDLVGLSDEVKNLILASVMKKVYEEMSDVITVLPEAAKYIHAGIGSPVKWVFNRVLSEGRSVGNYVWLDMQNLKGVDKEPIRNISIRLFGVQPDAYEIVEMRKALPMGENAPKAEEIMSLGVGQFYAKLKGGFVKVYARPVWLPEAVAVDVAKGKVPADSDFVQDYKTEYLHQKSVDQVAESFIEAGDKLHEKIREMNEAEDWAPVVEAVERVRAKLR